MDSRLAVMFAALLLSTVAGMLHIMFSSAQTANIFNARTIYSGMPVSAQRIYKKTHIFSHAIVVLYVPAIG